MLMKPGKCAFELVRRAVDTARRIVWTSHGCAGVFGVVQRHPSLFRKLKFRGRVALVRWIRKDVAKWSCISKPARVPDAYPPSHASERYTTGLSKPACLAPPNMSLYETVLEEPFENVVGELVGKLETSPRCLLTQRVKKTDQVVESHAHHPFGAIPGPAPDGAKRGARNRGRERPAYPSL